ncbi:hypothetical protein [Streptomyces syringium]|uniref:hypothetical protein n=1 Tax=Streptomyces syringium TaxID=76729 RepID=UPI003AAE7F3F
MSTSSLMARQVVNLVPVPIPGRVEELIAEGIPEDALVAWAAAERAAHQVHLSRGPHYAEARERALADVARNNKIAAAHNPGLIVTAGGAR